MARWKKFEPSDAARKTVARLVAAGYRQADICKVIKNPQTKKPIDEKTLRLAFPVEIAEGQQIALGMVAGALYQTAMDRSHNSHASAAMYILERRDPMRYKKPDGNTVLTHVGPNGGPVQSITANVQTAEEFAAIARRIASEI
jgi:hypothetical protein